MSDSIRALLGEIRVIYNDAFRVIYPATNADQVEGLTAAMEDRIVIQASSAYQAATVYPNKVLCFESDTGYVKMGDGVTAWSSLGYVCHDPNAGANAATIRTIMAPVEDTHANFVDDDPVIPLGVLAIETDRIGVKVGDGTHNWSDLPYRVDQSIYTEPFVIQTYNSTSGEWETVEPLKFSFMVKDTDTGEYVAV